MTTKTRQLRGARGRQAPPPPPVAGLIRVDNLGRVTSDRIEAGGGLGPSVFAPRPGAARVTVPRPGPAPGEPGNPVRRPVAARVARYVIASGTGQLTGRQMSRLLRDWDTAPRDGETPAGALSRGRAELAALAALAWAEHVKARASAAELAAGLGPDDTVTVADLKSPPR